jgi:hypothetical protein
MATVPAQSPRVLFLPPVCFPLLSSLLIDSNMKRHVSTSQNKSFSELLVTAVFHS